MKSILSKILIGIILFLIVIVIYVFIGSSKTFDAPYPEITAGTDSALIARGKYLAYGPAHCASCHIPMENIPDVERGNELPLSGGWEFKIPPGTLHAPNLTPDMETGIGKYTDQELARAMRHSVKRNGKLLFPVMPFQEMSDEDIRAIISFLRSQPPVKNKVEETSFSFLGKALLAFGVLKPQAPKFDPPKSMKIDSTVAYGEYMAKNVANCVGCHTPIDLMTGANIGPEFSGGFLFTPDEFSKGYAFISPNITPDISTGVMAKWDEETFVNRMRRGRVHEGSHMPWGFYSRMTEIELKSVYRYLQQLEPVENKIEKTIFAPGEELPE